MAFLVDKFGFNVILCKMSIMLNFIHFIEGSEFFARNYYIPEFKRFRDMAVVASEKVPELSRKDLMEIIHKSQYFQDIFTDQPDPMKIQFGHVCENPNEWEQRFEQRDFNKNHYQGKMRWGNKNGDYGEQYWDLGHAG